MEKFDGDRHERRKQRSISWKMHSGTSEPIALKTRQLVNFGSKKKYEMELSRVL